jgi:hypothetical protein
MHTRHYDLDVLGGGGGCAFSVRATLLRISLPSFVLISSSISEIAANCACTDGYLGIPQELLCEVAQTLSAG